MSSDHIHPSAQGYQLIASVLKNETGYVSKTPVSLPVGLKYAIFAKSPTYGEIVSQKNGEFYYAEPFYADQNTPYIAKVLTADTVVYSNQPVTISQTFRINTEVTDFKIHGMDVDSMTAYGKGWNWNMNGLPWVGNGFDLTTVDRFISGPCKGKSMGQCNFETRSEFLINGAEVESIYAYGKYWNFYAENSTPWPSAATSHNGSDITSVTRYANGPCKGKVPGTCTFTTRQQVFLSNGHWEEEVVAYDEKWDWDENGNLVSHTPVTSLPVAVVSSPVNLSVDLNHDGKVDAADYQYLRSCYGLTDSQSSAACPHPSWADLNNDGVVNGVDYNLFLRTYVPKQ